MPKQRLLDFGSYATIGITLVLFIVSLFLTGFTHDLLLEAGVFLVSAKLVLMGYKNGVASEKIRRELNEIRQLLAGLQD